MTFLFANIIVSGVKLIGFDRIDRRTHYIVATSLALGVGTALVPAFSSPGIGASEGRPNQWWPHNDNMSDALDSFRVGCMISINTPYFIGSICAIVLNLVIPTDLIDDAEIEVEETWHLKEGEGEEIVKDPKELSSEDDDAVDNEVGGMVDRTEDAEA